MFSKRTKIICTIGPSCTDEAVLEDMLRSGMNVARFNFSHGTHETHKNTIELFRRVRDRIGYSAAVMLDTRGPEIRLGTFAGDSALLESGKKFVITTREVEGDCSICSVSYKDLPDQLKRGDRVLVDDGNIQLLVDSVSGTDIVCTVLYGGVIRNHKGVNIPGVRLNMPYLSQQDKSDLLFGIENDVDFIAASFVRYKEDVIELRKFLDYYGGHKIRIIAKIENTEGIENFESILEYCDGIMVARGDMGVEVEYERLPGIQKRFIRKCYSSGKVVITATQMLESMVHNATPTRAEITDVANAVFDGTSAVMLSGETAMGDHPALVVKTMSKIVRQAEKDAMDLGSMDARRPITSAEDTTVAICDAACTTARDVCAKAIIAVTMSGYTARGVSRFRPPVPVVAATPDIKTFHQLSLSWGVYPVFALSQKDEENLFVHAVDCAKKHDCVKSGDTVVITAGVPLGVSGHTNILKVEKVEDCYR